MYLLALQSLAYPPILPISTPNSCFSRSKTTNFPSSFLRTLKTTSNFSLRAKNGENDDLSKDPDGQKEERTLNEPSMNGGGGEVDPKRDQRPAFNLRWGDLLNPDPDNLVAVGLAGLLTWSSVQVLWQLFFISAAIVIAALKYSFIAALLLFILITLL